MRTIKVTTADGAATRAWATADGHPRCDNLHVAGTKTPDEQNSVPAGSFGALTIQGTVAPLSSETGWQQASA